MLATGSRSATGVAEMPAPEQSPWPPRVDRQEDRAKSQGQRTTQALRDAEAVSILSNGLQY